ncbi:MAG: RidA family protein [Planctomycetes bacterium]|nr:RidA family protein [Planctomycetota bacterium]
MRLVDHPTGNYRFLPGIAPYSCGAVSSPGFEIANVIFQRPIPYRTGFERIARLLDEQGRPKTALCAISLRSARPYSFQGFADCNAVYTSILERWGVFVDGVNPIARTNVAPVVDPPSEPVLYGFSFTKPCAGDRPPTFVVAGAGELPEGILSRDAIVALGDTSPRGLTIKAGFVMDLMESRLRGLGMSWMMVSFANIYTAHSITELLPAVILSRMSAGAIHGVHWHFSRPPIEEIEFEMDLRGTNTELRCN